MRKHRITGKHFTTSDTAHFIIYSYLQKKFGDPLAYEHSTEIVREIKSVLNFSERLKGVVAPQKTKKK